MISGPVSGKQTYRALYFGDNWRATSKLTLNLGLRYELQGTWSERFDKMTYFDPEGHKLAPYRLQRCGWKPLPGRSLPGKDWRQRYPQQLAAFEKAVHAPAGICVFA